MVRPGEGRRRTQRSGRHSSLTGRRRLVFRVERLGKRAARRPGLLDRVFSHAGLWLAEDFPLGVLKRHPTFGEVGNSAGYARAFFFIARFLEVGAESLGCLKPDYSPSRDFGGANISEAITAWRTVAGRRIREMVWIASADKGRRCATGTLA